MAIVSAILLAAGESRRFNRFKLVEKIVVNGETYGLLEYLVSKYIGIDSVSEVVIVTGYRMKELVDSIRYTCVKYVYNRAYMEGMSSSVKTGLEAIRKYSDIAIIHPGDIVFTKKETLETLIEKALELYNNGREFILLPSYMGKKGGHPLLVSRGLFNGVMEIDEETRGLKGFLERYRDYKVYLETSDLGVLYDIDTIEDLVKAEELFGVKWVRD